MIEEKNIQRGLAGLPGCRPRSNIENILLAVTTSHVQSNESYGIKINLPSMGWLAVWGEREASRVA